MAIKRTFDTGILVANRPSLLRAFWLPTALVVGYLVFVWYVVDAIGRRDRTMGEYRAARDLPANTRLREQDVVRPKELPHGYFWYLPDFDKELKGRYLNAEMQAKQSIRPDNLRVRPSSLVDGPTVTLPLDGQAGLTEILNAGMKVKLCPPGGKCYDGNTWAIVCSPGEKSCYGMFRMQTEDAKIIQEAKSVTTVIGSVTPK